MYMLIHTRAGSPDSRGRRTPTHNMSISAGFPRKPEAHVVAPEEIVMTSVPDRHAVLRDALSQLHRDDLVDELQSRLQAVLRTHTRVDRLLEAVLAVASNLERE